MVRLAVIGALALTLNLISPAVASAQMALTGLLTGHFGEVRSGDVRNGGFAPGASLAVIEENGIGAELDIAHAREFDADRFAESGITSLMLNVLGHWPHRTYRPFVLAGVGVIRARAAIFDGIPVASRTDVGFDAGGGLLVLFNDVIGVRGDVRYFRYFERHADLPVLDNGFFDFWRVSVGATFAWPIR